MQADLKAFARCGVYGATAITAITAQNTVGVFDVQEVAPEMILAQVRAVCSDMAIGAVKVGMAGSIRTVEAVARALDLTGSVPIVVDPVMVSGSGTRLLDEDAVAVFRESILPRAAVVTPNVEEACVLVGTSRPADAAGLAELARFVHRLGPDAVVITGGDRESGEDILFDEDVVTAIPGKRYSGIDAHGSGCTHSSILTACLALGMELPAAARCARSVTAEAVRHGLAGVGKGPGPVDVLGDSAQRVARCRRCGVMS